MFEGVASRVRAAAVDALMDEAEEVASLARARAKGSLADHISVELEQDGESRWKVTVKSADPHGRAGDPKAKDPAKYNVPFFREHGTRYQAASPYMRPAIEARREELPKRLRGAISKAAKGRGGRIRRRIHVRLQARG